MRPVSGLWRVGAVLGLAAISLAGCGQQPNQESGQEPAKPSGMLPGDAQEIIKARQLNPQDVSGALATYMPTGRFDDYVMFASGGHSGQLLVIGLPSMRLLRQVAVFTPESWTGYGIGVQENALLVKPNDPRAASAVLLRVMDNDDLGKRLGQNAAKFAAAASPNIKSAAWVVGAIIATCIVSAASSTKAT